MQWPFGHFSQLTEQWTVPNVAGPFHFEALSCMDFDLSNVMLPKLSSEKHALPQSKIQSYWNLRFLFNGAPTQELVPSARFSAISVATLHRTMCLKQTIYDNMIMTLEPANAYNV